MEEKIKELHLAIVAATKSFHSVFDVFGPDDISTQKRLEYLTGLQDAFKIITGMSDVDYMISETEVNP